MPNWLAMLDVPLFVSHRRLKDRRTFPRASTGWALDSGGFSELSMYGEWRTTPKVYATTVERYQREIGMLEWVAPQDWMCEPMIIAKTGLSVKEHQRRTIQSYMELRDAGLPVIPVLQGWVLPDYMDHIKQYERAGITLQEMERVGLGSVCRRQATGEIAQMVRALAGIGLRLHGFGVKTNGLRHYGHYLVSADSMAWSYGARRENPIDGHAHKTCSNCPDYALAWRTQVINQVQSEYQMIMEME